VVNLGDDTETPTDRSFVDAVKKLKRGGKEMTISTLGDHRTQIGKETRKKRKLKGN